ncbi:MAG: hypothetical protein Q7S04_02945 [Candidatus Moranbacteria bacterium]|nr:hypothetical protein [Candidatus Moranbacteria bacterium]
MKNIYYKAKEEDETPLHMSGFVPFRLELKNFPKYDNFPYNILFAGDANIDGVDMSGSALYFPDFSTFQESEKKQSMTYFNQYSREWTVVIEYDKQRGSWEGSKYYKGEFKGGGGGTEWRMAFAHLTMAGLANGERVEFEKI